MFIDVVVVINVAIEIGQTKSPFVIQRSVADGWMTRDKTSAVAKGYDILAWLGGYFDHEIAEGVVREPRDVAGPNSGDQGEPARGKGVKQEAGDLSRDRGSPRAAGTVVHSPGEGTEVARGAAIDRPL